jgi:hypothetical protein
MHTLDHLRRLRSMIAAWVLLAMGVAMASPLVQPRAFELICSSAGAYLLVAHSDDGGAGSHTQDLNCGLCLMGAAPPPSALDVLPKLHAPRIELAHFHFGHKPDTTAALPPARAPPCFHCHS